MIDCSHANSSKDYKRQAESCRNVAGQLAAGELRIIGVMLESNLVEGAQKLVPGHPLVHGKSITDGCMGWDRPPSSRRTCGVRASGQAGVCWRAHGVNSCGGAEHLLAISIIWSCE